MGALMNVDELLSRMSEVCILDVRSPGEFLAGHIPGAYNLSLFSDEERAQVGTAYKQQSPEAAMRLGLKFAGEHLADYVRLARDIAADHPGPLVLHCWRGGQRSQAMAWLLSFAGLPIYRLEGGYKAFRQASAACFQDDRYTFRIIGGHTGAGKTEVVHALAGLGEQVIDLEGLAHHKGSAFGNIGEPDQPTNEQFENDLFLRLRALDPAKPVWLENESKNIGRVYLPEAFWQRMRDARLFALEVDPDVRLDRVMAYYSADNNIDALAEAFGKIRKRLGGLDYQRAMDALGAGDLRAAGRIALTYYDKSYTYQLNQWPADRVVTLENCTSVEDTARRLIAAASVHKMG